ncbi:MAG: basic amino acid ABC transporter substrate-binding protein, partial [Bacillota bacterium]|nr:basic amino acid ABC transporter substrate-binding protein [Bacillota bacterium]
MKTNKRLTLIAAAVVLTLGFTGCSSAKNASNQAGGTGTKKITVAAINDYPPFEFKKDGKLTGFDIELVEAIAKKANLQVEWKEMKFDGIIPALQGNQIDAAISAITIRDDRKQVVNFTDPYFKSGLSLVVKKDSSINSLEDLKGKTIVAKQGTTGLAKAKELADKYGAKVKILQDDTALYLDVETGNSDATINDFPSAAYKIKVDGDNSKLRILGDKLTGEDYGIAITKDNKELLDKFNQALKQLQDSGE